MKARHARTIRAGIAEGRTLWGSPFSDNPYVLLEKPNLFQRAVLAEHQNDPDFHIWPKYVREWLDKQAEALHIYAKTDEHPKKTDDQEEV